MTAPDPPDDLEPASGPSRPEPVGYAPTVCPHGSHYAKSHRDPDGRLVWACQNTGCDAEWRTLP